MGIWQKIKLVFAGRKVVREAIKAHDNAKSAYEKSSWKSTEFWTAVLLGLGAIIAQATGILPEPYGAIAASVSAALYAIGRGMVKKEDPLGGAKPGVSTTEFWGNLLVQVGNVSAASVGAVNPETAAILMIVSNAAYGVSRSLAKGGAQPEDMPVE